MTPEPGLPIPKDHFRVSWSSLLRGGGVVVWNLLFPIRVSCSERERELDEGPAPGPHLSLGRFSKLLSQVIKGPLPRTFLTRLSSLKASWVSLETTDVGD